MEYNAIQIMPGDNVVVLTAGLPAGETVTYQSPGGPRSFVLRQDVPIYHKAACAPIGREGRVIKYGEEIGTTFCAVQTGDYLHVHNFASARDPRRKEMAERCASL